MKRPADAYWYSLKDKARMRGGNKCEYCQLRKVRDLHHRTYVREGAELMEDVMCVCKICHRVIHGRHTRRTFLVKPGSLADQGDTGTDFLVVNKYWKAYLKRSA